MMKKLSTFFPFLASIPAWFFIQFVGWTNRFYFEGQDIHHLLKNKKGPFIFALWHNRVMLPIFPFRNRGIAVIVSRSQDGEYITEVMKRFGFFATRGSGSRNGSEGLLGLVHWLKHGGSAVITPDGPRGPRERVQGGIVQLSKLARIPVVPVCFSCSRNHRFASWDRFMLPLPFGRIVMVTGNPIEVPHDLDQESFEEKRLAIEEELRRITRIADQWAGVEILEPGDPNASR